MKKSLTVAIEQALASTQCHAGMRLRSEADLADVLQVGRRQVRDSLLYLEQKGVLTRRRGSGTYLRRVPEVKSYAPDQTRSIPVEQLLAPESSRLNKLESPQSTSSQRKLHLALWSDLQFTTSTARLAFGGMVRRADELGHRMTLHSLLDHDLSPLAPAEIQRLVEWYHPDGCLLIAWCAEQFVNAAGTAIPRTMFFNLGTMSPRFEPTIMFDTSGAIRRAIEILADEGFTRIGFVGLGDIRGHDGKIEAQSYKAAIAARGFDYSFAVTKGLSLKLIIESICDLFNSPQRPDALYVADDHLLEGVEQALSILNLVPGRDVGLITLSNVGCALPPGIAWSRMEFDPAELGMRVVDELLRWIQIGRSSPLNLSIGASWKAGETHMRSAGPRNKTS